jgi:hypothetical protein
MQWVVAFVSGFVSTLVFHQGLIGVLYWAGVAPSAPFAVDPVPPLGVPVFVSLAFWGGVWGLPIWWLVRRTQGAVYWLAGVASGAAGPTAVALLVVFPLKGREVTLEMVPAGLLVNAAWGLGLMVLMYPWARRHGKVGPVDKGPHHGA